MSGTIDITWARQRFTLWPERALLWSSGAGGDARPTLVIADPHFGKAAAFRSHGIPVPPGSTTASLQRLSRVLTQTHAERLIILGDFFHARRGRADATLDVIGRWRAKWPDLQIVLVRGNHDLGSGDPPEEWRVECVSEPWRAGPLRLCHAPPARPAGPTLAGHLHPMVTLHDALGTTVRAPCFHFGARVGVLPAFGTFTGGHSIRPRRGDQVFAVGEDEVAPIAMR